MHLLMVSASSLEIKPFQDHLEKHFVPFEPFRYQRGELTVSVLITGVGLPLMAFAMGKALAKNRFDLAVNAGIAGAFHSGFAIGQVVQVVSEQFGDLGVEEADGRFTHIHTLGLIAPNQPPFENGVLRNTTAGSFDFLPKAKGLSVNKVHGCQPSIDRIRNAFSPDIETMEGAAFFYACLMEDIPFLEIRAISNFVEPRNRENWNIPLAVQQLNAVLQEMVESLSE